MFSIIVQTANLDQLDEKIDQQLMSEKETSNISCNSEKITRTTRSASLSKRTKSDPAIKLGRKHKSKCASCAIIVTMKTVILIVKLSREGRHLAEDLLIVTPST